MTRWDSCHPHNEVEAVDEESHDEGEAWKLRVPWMMSKNRSFELF
jgi:hypothetical protein